MKIIIILISVITLSVSLLQVDFIRNKASDTFWDWFAYQMDKEEAERMKKIERHEVVRGKDTAYIWNKHYEVWSQSGNKYFGIETEETSDVLLLKAYLIDVYNEQFYVVAKDGYAVVDKNNMCRIFLLTNEDMVESKYIEYLTSYQDFSEEEQAHFGKMIKKEKVSLYK